VVAETVHELRKVGTSFSLSRVFQISWVERRVEFGNTWSGSSECPLCSKYDQRELVCPKCSNIIETNLPVCIRCEGTSPTIRSVATSWLSVKFEMVEHPWSGCVIVFGDGQAKLYKHRLDPDRPVLFQLEGKNPTPGQIEVGRRPWAQLYAHGLRGGIVLPGPFALQPNNHGAID
jgi:hypothetical protein